MTATSSSSVIAPAFEALAQAVASAARSGPGAAAARLRLYLVLARQQDLLDEELFPALLESMAGSDAVCIRDMRLRCSAMAAELRAQLARRPGGDDADLLASRSAEYLAYLADEVFPMAERLLP